MKRITATLVNVLLFVFAVTGQQSPSETNALPDIIPPTPEAFALGKFGSNPIGMFTGAVSYSVPLYNIKVGEFNLPVSVSYNSNGLKVDEVASSVGIQWKMDFVGVINRTVVGLPDENEQGGSRPSTHDTSSWAFYNFLKNAGPGGSGEEAHPDIFSYSIPGYSGKFVFDRNKAIVQIPYNNLQIVCYSHAASLDSFRIVTSEGNIFIFGKNGNYDITVNNSQGGDYVCIPQMPENGAVTAWYLNCIRLANGREISFEYEGIGGSYLTGVNQTYSFKPLYIDNPYSFHYNEYPFKTCYQLNEFTSRRIKSILFPTGKVKLYYSYREDIEDEIKLDSLHILTLDSTVVKKWKFRYQYSYNSSTAFDSKAPSFSNYIQNDYPELRKRLFLTGVVDYMGTDSLEFKFDYNAIDSLPPRLSYAQDYWGYFNGVAGQESLFFPAYTLGGYYLWDGIEYGADRRGHFPSAQKGMLKRITYPTGGYTDYTYEPVDSFLSWKPIYDTLTFSSSVNPSSYTYTSGSFTLHEGISKVLITPSAAPYEPPGEFEPEEPMPDTLLYFTIRDGNNDIVYSYIGSVWQELYMPQLRIVNTGSYTFTFESQYPPSVSFNVKIYGYTTQNQPLTPAAGMRVKSIVDNDGFGNLQNKRTFLYNQGGGPEQVINPNDEGIYYCPYRLFDGTLGGLGHHTIMQLFSSSLFPLYRSDAGAVTYNRVIEQYQDKLDSITGGIEHTYLVIPKTKPTFLGEIDYFYMIGGPIATDSSYLKIKVPGGSYTNTDLHNGTELETKVFKMNSPGTRKIVNKTRNVYSIDSRWSYTDTLYSVRKTFNADDLHWITIKYFIDFDVNKYFVYSNWMHLDTTITTSYPETGDSMITSQCYTYGNVGHMQPTIIKQLNSKGDSLSTTYKYPYDFSGTSPYTEMISRNMITSVIEQSQKNITLNKDLSKTKTNYQFWQTNNLIAPSTVEHSVLNNSLQTILRFSSYDNKRNIITVSKENNIRMSYVWDYDQSYPVAQVTNADSTSIAFTSFEADGKGNWAFSGSTTTHPSAPTGKKGYSLAGGDITKSGLTSGTIYIVTYWKRDSSSTVTVNSGSGTLVTTLNGWKLYSHEVTGITDITVSGTAYIDELRLYPKDALMTTYTYSPLIGMTSQCDVNNRVNYYEYDGFGRLKLIKDQEGRILKRMDYKYQASYQQ